MVFKLNPRRAFLAAAVEHSSTAQLTPSPLLPSFGYYRGLDWILHLRLNYSGKQSILQPTVCKTRILLIATTCAALLALYVLAYVRRVSS